MTSNITLRALAVAAGALTLTACATTTKVATVQPGDRGLSCGQLKSEFNRLDAVMAEADHNKGINTANVAAVLFFWPAAVGNYMDADKAEKLVERRRASLVQIYDERQCDNPAAAAAAYPATVGYGQTVTATRF